MTTISTTKMCSALLAPKGRNEHGPHYNLVDWIKRYDMYESASQ
jgi:predicted dithiol-disulfide oxidoreductase (DUF899 family)